MLRPNVSARPLARVFVDSSRPALLLLLLSLGALLASAKRAHGQSPIIVTAASAESGPYRSDGYYRAWVHFTVTNTTAQSLSVHVRGDCGPEAKFNDWHFDWLANVAIDDGCPAINNSVTIAASQSVTVSSPFGYYGGGIFYDDPITLTVYPESNPGAASIGVARVTYNPQSWVLAAELVSASAVTTYTPAVSPKTSSVTTSSNTSSSMMIALSNTGTGAATYTLSTSCSGVVITCVFPDNSTTSTVAVAAGASTSVVVNYATGTTGANGTTGTTRLVVTAPPTSANVVQADTSTRSVTVSDVGAPTISLSPFRTPNVYSSAEVNLIVDVCDPDGSVQAPQLTLNGITVTAQSVTATTVSGCVAAKSAGFIAQLTPGNNNVTVSASDGVHTTQTTATYIYDETKPAVVPVQHITSMPPSTDTTIYFRVTNPRPTTANVRITLGPCELNIESCTLGNPPGINELHNRYDVVLAGGASVTVPAYFRSAPTTGELHIGLSAGYSSDGQYGYDNPDLTRTLYIENVNVVGSPPPPPPPPTGDTAAVIVTAVGTQLGPWVNPDTRRGYLIFTMQNRSGQPQSILVQLDCGNGAFDDWDYDPETQTQTRTCEALSGTVSIPATETATVTSPLGLSSWYGEGNVTMSYRPSNAGPEATKTAVAHVMWNYTTSVLTAQLLEATHTPAVSPKTSTVAVSGNSSNYFGITLTNVGNAAASYAVIAQCSGVVTTCIVYPTSTTVIPVGGSVGIGLTYGVGASGGTGAVRVIVTAPPSSLSIVQADTTTINVTTGDLQSPTLSIVPIGEEDENGTRVDYWTSTHLLTLTVDACDADGTLQPPSLLVSGTGGTVAVAAQSLTATSVAGCSTATRSVFVTPLFPGYNTVTASVSDGAHTSEAEARYRYDDAPELAPRLMAVHPTVQVQPNAAVTDTVFIANAGWKTVSYNLSATCTHAAGGTCVASPGAVSVTVAANGSVKVPVTFQSPAALNAQTTVRLTAQYAAYFGTVSADVSFVATTSAMAAPQMTVIPANGTTTTTAVIPQLRVDWCDVDDAIVQHDLALNGQALPNSYLSTSVAGCASSGQSTYTNVVLVPWDNALVATARDAAGHVVTTTTTFTYNAPLTVFQPQVTPLNTRWHVLPAAGSIAAADTFMVRNIGAYPAAYAITGFCGFAVTLANCVPSKGAVSLPAGATEQIVVTYTRTGATDVADPLILSAIYTAPTGGYIEATATKYVSAPSDEPAPTVAGGSTMVMTPGTFANGNFFTIRNPGSVQVTYTPTFVTTGGFTLDPLWTEGVTYTIDPGQTISVQLTVRAPNVASTSGTVTFTASYVTTGGLTLSASASDTFTTSADTPQQPGVVIEVTPKTTASVPTSSVIPQKFTIANRGDFTATIDYILECPAIVSCSALHHQSASLGKNQTDTVSLTFTTQAVVGATGTIRLIASSVSVKPDTGRVTITTEAPGRPVAVRASSVNPGGSVPRDECVTIAAGDAAAFECGDLRLTHVLPATTTMNHARAPMLVYNSSHAAARAIVRADVIVQPGVSATSLRATLKFSNGASTSRTFSWNPDLSDARPRRIAVPIDPDSITLTTQAEPAGAFKYTLEVRAVNDTALFDKDTGTVVIVDRRYSPFGRGWWIDGLEQIRLITPDTSQRLWVGGDGATRLYSPLGTNLWTVSPALDRVDTLEKTTGGYRRHLPNGAFVEFNNAGKHIATVNQQQHTTRFTYTNSGLDSIVLPVPIGSSAKRAYKFGYDNASKKVNRVDAFGGRATMLGDVKFGGLWVVQTITDPDGKIVRFGYDGVNRISTRTNRRSHVTTYEYDAAGTLRRSTLDMAGTAAENIVQTFCASESASLTACAGGPQEVDQVMTWVDGPRSDVGDTTWFRITRFGAPERVVNALRYTTTIERGDTLWPLLATAVVQPNGHRIESFYSRTRALTDSTRDIKPFDDDRNAVTSIRWHSKFDKPETITAPTGEVARMGYYSNGDREWQEDGRGSLSRVTFWYGANRQLDSLLPPGNDPSRKERIAYDATLGNVAQTKTPLGFATDHFRDALGRDTLTLTPTDTLQTPSLKQRMRTVYNIMDRVDSTVSSGAAVLYALRSTPTYSAPVTTDTVYTANNYNEEGQLLSAVVTVPFSVNGEVRVGVVESWSYDAAGRPRTRVKTSAVDSTYYDAAGNVTRVRTASGGGVTQEFDELNRIRQKSVLARAYPQQRCEGFQASIISNPNSPTQCTLLFPAVPTSGTGFVVPADVATFTYDTLGNMRSADNNDARLRRRYYRNGALKIDSMSYRAAHTNGFGHFTALQLHYDVSGRRDALTLPDGETISYSYRSDNGALSTIIDPFATQYRYAYDASGRIDSLVVGTTGASAGVREKRWYDDDGRQYARERVSAAYGSLSTETIKFDAQGRVIVADYGTQANQSPASRTYFTYSGLGAVLARERIDVGTNNWEAEEFRVDALGNVLKSRSQKSGALAMPFVSSYAPRGAMLSRVAETDPDYPLAYDQLSQGADVDGHMIRSHHVARDRGNNYTIDNPSRSYYGWDGKLRAVQRYNGIRTDAQTGTWEEYRYDALGRRVMVIARPSARPDNCSPALLCAPLCSIGDCRDKVTWAFWDGDQLLREDRRAYPDGDLAQPYYGIVTYVHGTELDKPLAVIDPGQHVRVLNPNDRGLFESSVTPAGTFADCSLAWHNPGASCQQVAWPAGQAVYSRPLPFETGGSETIAWSGSLLTDQQDGTGNLYRRNRYYDPNAGRFTQEDPIGLAGGANLYGFASGDPLNYDDPFGLCPVVLALAGPAGVAIAATWCAGEVGALAATAAAIWFSKSRTSGETPATTGGRQAHKAWEPGAGFQKEFRLPSVKRCDALNPESCEIKELKPDNERAKKRGEKQLKEYKEERERETGREHKTTLETYKPKQP